MELTYDAALQWIHGRLPFGSRPGLERIEALLARLDNPQHKIKTIHIAGTNGKGSTVTFLRCLLEAQGLRVGTYTSPYITRFNERISINQQPIPDQDLVNLVAQLAPHVEALDQTASLAGATEFEVVTALMFEYFYQQQVDVAIVEVGLGGTLDCTNVITPLISGITTIGYDHQDILGATLPEIAAQKAGIIKATRPVVTGRINPEALNVIKAVARGLNSPVFQLEQAYQSSAGPSRGLLGETLTFSNELVQWDDLALPLIGRHQVDNAALALELFCRLSEDLSLRLERELVQAGLAQARWPGRMEVLQQSPLVMIDGAHNEPALEVLVAHLLRQKGLGKIHLVFAAINTKQVGKMLATIQRLPNCQLYLTTFDYPRAYHLEEYPVADLADYQLWPDWQEGIDQLQPQLGADDLLLITGSLYFISQVRAYVLGGQDDNH